MSSAEVSTPFATEVFGRRRSTLLDVVIALMKQPAGQVGILITLLVVGSALAAPLLHLLDPIQANPTNVLAPPDAVN